MPFLRQQSEFYYNMTAFINTYLWISAKILLSVVMSTEEEKELVTVYTARQMEAQILKGRLESAGIPALLSYESAGLVYGLTVNGLGEVKILVPKHLANEAKEILGI
jgi:hypothetical protein